MGRLPGQGCALLVGIGVLVAVVAAGCSAEDSTDERFADLLDHLPNDEALHDEHAAVWLADFERLREAREVSRPSVDLVAEDDLDHHEELLGDGRPMPWTRFLNLDHFPASTELLRSALGIGFTDVDQWIFTMPAPGDAGSANADYFAATGAFEADQADEHLAACDDCDEPERRTGGEHDYYDWAEATEDGPLTLQHVGSVAVGNGFVLRSASSEHMERMLATRDEASSLADDEPYRLLAERFDALDAIEAMLTGFTQDVEHMPWLANLDGETLPPEIAPAFATGELPLLEPYVAVGSGWSESGDDPATHVLLVHESTEIAHENAGRLEERFDEFLARDIFPALEQHLRVERYEAIDVEAHDRVLVATLTGGDGGIFESLYHFPLFLHE